MELPSFRKEKSLIGAFACLDFIKQKLPWPFAAATKHENLR